MYFGFSLALFVTATLIASKGGNEYALAFVGMYIASGLFAIADKK